MAQTTDTPLTATLVAAHAGDQVAARALWAAVGPRLRGFAVGLLRDPAAADDAVQAALVRVLGLGAAEVAQVADPLAYLLAAVRHAALDGLRADRRRTAREHAASDGAALGDGGLAAALPDAGGGDGELARTLDRLNHGDREVLLLKHIAGLTFDQMALVLGLPRGTAVARHGAALSRLRAVMTGKREGVVGGMKEVTRG